jgi:hypothetical protein
MLDFSSSSENPLNATAELEANHKGLDKGVSESLLLSLPGGQLHKNQTEYSRAELMRAGAVIENDCDPQTSRLKASFGSLCSAMDFKACY